jgi:hypothetical protein
VFYNKHEFGTTLKGTAVVKLKDVSVECYEILSPEGNVPLDNFFQELTT